jgi:hypothetical protein
MGIARCVWLYQLAAVRHVKSLWRGGEQPARGRFQSACDIILKWKTFAPTFAQKVKYQQEEKGKEEIENYLCDIHGTREILVIHVTSPS